MLVALGGATAVQAAGDVAKGKALYNICAACHGVNAEGTAALNAPANAGQDPWYMTRQLNNFRAGVRGAHPDDTFGAQMRPMAMVLAGDQDIEDVVAYITSLDLPDPQQTVDGEQGCHGVERVKEGNDPVEIPALLVSPFVEVPNRDREV